MWPLRMPLNQSANRAADLQHNQLKIWIFEKGWLVNFVWNASNSVTNTKQNSRYEATHIGPPKSIWDHLIKLIRLFSSFCNECATETIKINRFWQERQTESRFSSLQKLIQCLQANWLVRFLEREDRTVRHSSRAGLNFQKLIQETKGLSNFAQKRKRHSERG